MGRLRDAGDGALAAEARHRRRRVRVHAVRRSGPSNRCPRLTQRRRHPAIAEPSPPRSHPPPPPPPCACAQGVEAAPGRARALRPPGVARRRRVHVLLAGQQGAARAGQRRLLAAQLPERPRQDRRDAPLEQPGLHRARRPARALPRDVDPDGDLEPRISAHRMILDFFTASQISRTHYQNNASAL